jgi:hypothetical protein
VRSGERDNCGKLTWHQSFESHIFSVWPSLEPLVYVLANVMFVMWTGYTGSRYFSILRRVLKRRQFSAFHYNVPLLARVYNFVSNAGSNDDHLYSVSCIANTVFTLEEICTRWDALWWITTSLYPLKVSNNSGTKEWCWNTWNPTYENTRAMLA